MLQWDRLEGFALDGNLVEVRAAFESGQVRDSNALFVLGLIVNVDERPNLRLIIGLLVGHCGRFTWPGLLLKCDSAERIRRLVSRGVDIDAVDDYGDTALITTIKQYSTLYNYEHSPRMLLECGANPNMVSTGGNRESALMTACYNTSAPVDLIRLLLENGADATYQDSRGSTALHCAFSNWWLGHDRPEITALLLQYGANVNVATKCGYTALHRCVERGFVQSTRLLIKAGADVNAV